MKIDIKFILLEIIKWASAVCALVFVVSMLSSGKVSNTDIETMTNAVIAETDTSNMQEADNQMIKRLYGLNPEDYDGITLYYPITNMGAEEILIVKLKDTSQQSTVKAAIDARLETQLNSFEGYGAEQTAMLESCVIKTSGNYMALIVAADPSKPAAAFDDAL